jgi:hypothetical protein
VSESPSRHLQPDPFYPPVTHRPAPFPPFGLPGYPVPSKFKTLNSVQKKIVDHPEKPVKNPVEYFRQVCQYKIFNSETNAFRL